MKKVTILNFSARKEGNCAKIAQYISVHSTATTVCAYVVDRRIGPCGDCDYECLRPNACCPNVTDYQKEVMNSVMNSDVTYLIVPNYCGFPCANYRHIMSEALASLIWTGRLCSNIWMLESASLLLATPKAKCSAELWSSRQNSRTKCCI